MAIKLDDAIRRKKLDAAAEVIAEHAAGGTWTFQLRGQLGGVMGEVPLAIRGDQVVAEGTIESDGYCVATFVRVGELEMDCDSGLEHRDYIAGSTFAIRLNDDPDSEAGAITAIIRRYLEPADRPTPERPTTWREQPSML